MSDLASRFRDAQQRVAEATRTSGRSDDVTMIVVTKHHPAQLVLDLIELGARDFGENRDQEAAPKSAEVARQNSEGINWHYVGQLQTNKAKSAIEYTSVLHSLDRESLLQTLTKLVAERTVPLDVFIQLNLTEDPGRGGIAPDEMSAFAEKVLAVHGLNLMGVMGVAALDREPEVDFETIARCSSELQRLAPKAHYISAGMSGDFEKAIAFGATHVRIGTAITGNRAY